MILIILTVSILTVAIVKITVEIGFRKRKR